MRKLLFLLLLIPLASEAGEQSVAKQLYLDDVTYEIESIMGKKAVGAATDYDEFMLQKLSSRLVEVTQHGSRILFTNAITDREPEQELNSADRGGDIFLFTEIIGQAGKTVTHIWYADGVEVFSKSFDIGSDRWRIWSSKNVGDSKQLTVLIYSDADLIAATAINIL